MRWVEDVARFIVFISVMAYGAAICGSAGGLPPSSTLAIEQGAILFGVHPLADDQLLVQRLKGKLYSVLLWDLSEGRGQETISFQGPMGGSAISPCGRWLAAEFRPSAEAWALGVWDVNTGELMHELELTDPVADAVFNPDGSLLAILLLHGSAVALWDVRASALRYTLVAPNPLSWVTFSPDGRVLAAGSVDRTVRLWNVATGEEANVLSSATYTTGPALFAPSGRTLAVCSEGYQIVLWDMLAGRVTLTLSSHLDRVASLAFSSDSQVLATASWDGTIRLWSVGTGQEMCTLDLRSALEDSEYDRWAVMSVAFAPDGTVLFSASMAWRWERTPWGPAQVSVGLVHLWHVGELLEVVRAGRW